MIAFEVRLNGKRIGIAGAEDLTILNAHVTACGTLGKRTVAVRPNEPNDIFFTVGGLTARPKRDEDVHVYWISGAPLRVGDVVQVTVLEADKADRASKRRRAVRKR